MANAVVTIRVMPSGVEVDLAKLAEEIKGLIENFAGKGEMKVSETPIAFGLKAIDMIFVMDEALGSPEKLEKQIAEIEDVQSVEVTDVRRAIG